MAPPARNDILTRRSWLLAGLGGSVCARLWAALPGALQLSMDGEMLYISAPDLHFLTGKPLERLRDGLAVTYVAQLSLSLDDNRTIFRRQPQQFVLSYDIWEEKFAVRINGPARKGFSAEKAEAWCLDNLAISTSGIAADTPVWLRLDLRVVDSRDPLAAGGEGGLSLATLIKIFSQPPRAPQASWIINQGPFRLADLKKPLRGPRGG